MRTFLALEVPTDVVAYLEGVISRLERRTEGVRWVRKEGIHVTMKFLGEIEEAMAARMKETLGPLGMRFSPVAARLGSLDAFPTRRSARVIVVKLKEGVPEVQSLFSEVEERLAGLGLEKEKRGLVPHLTLGRRRQASPFPDGDPLPIEERGFVMDHLVLFKSTLTPAGAVYEPIWKIKLGGEDR